MRTFVRKAPGHPALAGTMGGRRTAPWATARYPLPSLPSPHFPHSHHRRIHTSPSDTETHKPPPPNTPRRPNGGAGVFIGRPCVPTTNPPNSDGGCVGGVEWVERSRRSRWIRWIYSPNRPTTDGGGVGGAPPDTCLLSDWDAASSPGRPNGHSASSESGTPAAAERGLPAGHRPSGSPHPRKDTGGEKRPAVRLNLERAAMGGRPPIFLKTRLQRRGGFTTPRPKRGPRRPSPTLLLGLPRPAPLCLPRSPFRGPGSRRQFRLPPEFLRNLFRETGTTHNAHTTAPAQLPTRPRSLTPTWGRQQGSPSSFPHRECM